MLSQLDTTALPWSLGCWIPVPALTRLPSLLLSGAFRRRVFVMGRAGPGTKRQRVALWQLALAASALILLGLNVGAVFNSNIPYKGDDIDEVSAGGVDWWREEAPGDSLTGAEAVPCPWRGISSSKGA